MQTIIPLFAFWVSWLGFSEGLRQYRAAKPSLTKRHYRMCCIFICFSESGAVFFTGLVNILGQYGPVYLPIAYHDFFWTQLTGLMLYNSMLIALMMREHFRAFFSRQELRSLVKVQSRTMLLLWYMPSLDLLVGLARALKIDDTFGVWFYIGIFLVFIATAAYAAVVFLLQAAKVGASLRIVRVDRERRGQADILPDTIRVSRHITKCLVVNGAALLFVIVYSTWTVTALLRGVPHLGEFLACSVIVPPMRAFVAYWHVSPASIEVIC